MFSTLFAQSMRIGFVYSVPIVQSVVYHQVQHTHLIFAWVGDTPQYAIELYYFQYFTINRLFFYTFSRCFIKIRKRIFHSLLTCSGLCLCPYLCVDFTLLLIIWLLSRSFVLFVVHKLRITTPVVEERANCSAIEYIHVIW